MLECPICKSQLSKIDSQHLRKHGLTKEEYFLQYGKDAPFGLSKELKEKKSGINHPRYGKTVSEETKNKISQSIAKLWEEDKVTDNQRNAIGKVSKEAKESGKHFNTGRAFNRDEFYKKKLSESLKQYYLENPKSEFDKTSERYLRQLEIINQIAETRKVETLAKFDEQVKSIFNWAVLQNEDIDIFSDKPRIVCKCNTCGSIIDRSIATYKKHNYSNSICHSCFPPLNGSSKAEQEIYEFIQNECQLEDIQQHVKNILPNNLELDIFIPSYKIAIEYHGLFWHSNAMDYKQNRHREKYELCQNLGIRLIQIFEDEWIYSKDIVKNKLLHILGKNTTKRIFARKCECTGISHSEASEFLERNHIQGGKIKSPYRFGLKHEGKLVAVMTFGKPRIAMNQKSTYENCFELVRFATSIDCSVVGGGQKLLSFAIRKLGIMTVLSWADLRWTNPNKNVYLTLGFTKLNETKTGYFYTDLNKRFHRFGFKKPKDSLLNEEEYWKEKGFYKISDCGQINYILKTQ